MGLKEYVYFNVLLDILLITVLDLVLLIVQPIQIILLIGKAVLVSLYVLKLQLPNFMQIIIQDHALLIVQLQQMEHIEIQF